QTRFTGSKFVRVFFCNVAELSKRRMAEQRVVVKADLGVECDQLTRFCNDKRIDLRETAIEIDEQLTERTHELLGRADAGACDAKFRAELANLIRLQAAIGMEGLDKD